MRRYPVTFKRVTQQNDDFGRTEREVTDLVRTGGTARSLTVEERTLNELRSDQDGIRVTCQYTPQLGGVASHSHVIDFMGHEYRILRIDKGVFDKRTISFVIGRNA